MALHDWAALDGWEGVHQFWVNEIARDLKANLPPGYRAAVGASPLVLMPESRLATDAATGAVVNLDPTYTRAAADNYLE